MARQEHLLRRIADAFVHDGNIMEVGSPRYAQRVTKVLDNAAGMKLASIKDSHCNRLVAKAGLPRLQHSQVTPFAPQPAVEPATGHPRLQFLPPRTDELAILPADICYDPNPAEMLPHKVDNTSNFFGLQGKKLFVGKDNGVDIRRKPGDLPRQSFTDISPVCRHLARMQHVAVTASKIMDATIVKCVRGQETVITANTKFTGYGEPLFPQLMLIATKPMLNRLRSALHVADVDNAIHRRTVAPEGFEPASETPRPPESLCRSESIPWAAKLDFFVKP